MKLTYYGHSCFAVEAGGKILFFDPFIKPNELAKDIDFKSIKADYILLSHGHFDHTADCIELAKQTNATVIAAFDITEWVSKQGVEKVHPMNIGGKWDFDFGTVKCVNAVHSSVLPDGTYGGNPMGFLITISGKNFYYSGDSALTMDMQLVSRWGKPDFAVLCIGDNFTMGIEDAIEAAKMVDTKVVVGVHYETFGLIKIDHQQAITAFKDEGIDLQLPAIGETIDL
jgi:L-ascorbate metabolism protein UlaG (beta-lactamase superfamily)